MGPVRRAVLIALVVPSICMGQPTEFLRETTGSEFVGCGNLSAGSSAARRIALAMALAEAARSDEVRISSVVRMRGSSSNGTAERTSEYSVRVESEKTFPGFEIIGEKTIPIEGGGSSLCLAIRVGKEDGR